MIQTVRTGSALKVGDHVYIFAGSGDNDEYPIQRIDLAEEEQIAGNELIGSHENLFWWPILFETSADYCI